MRKRMALLGVTVCLVCMVCLAACGNREPDKLTEEKIAGKSYVYGKDGCGGDGFVILLKSDGSYFYHEGALSSYIGRGKWAVEGGILILTEDEEMGREPGFANYFRVDGNDLVFLARNSSNFLYVNVADGDRFLETSPEETVWLSELTIR